MTETAPMVERLRAFAAQMVEGTPHARAIGMEVTKIDRAKAWGRVTPRPDLVGDPETGVIAGGVITTLLDNLGGVATMAALDEPTSIATLDLRIDYMRPARPGTPVLAMAHCYKLTRSVGFVRAFAYEADPEDPIATGAAAFMLGSNAGRRPGANTKPPV